jgi:hypothetical protein
MRFILWVPKTGLLHWRSVAPGGQGGGLTSASRQRSPNSPELSNGARDRGSIPRGQIRLNATVPFDLYRELYRRLLVAATRLVVNLLRDRPGRDSALTDRGM